MGETQLPTKVTLSFELQSFAQHLEKLLQTTKEKLHEKFDYIERKSHEKRVREKEKRNREYERKEREIRIRDFLEDPEYVKYIQERRMRKEARKQKKAFREKEKALSEKEELKEKNEAKFESAFEEKEKQESEVHVERRLENEVNEKESSAREGDGKEILVKEDIMDTCSNPNLFPSFVDSIVKEVEDKTSKDACTTTIVFEEAKANSIESLEKSWPSTTLIPSSKLACGFTCWDSSYFISLTNISSLGIEEKKVCLQEVITFCDFVKDNYALETKRKEEQANPSNKLQNFSNLEVTCDEFFILIFDPGGIRAKNSRSNFLEEGGNDMMGTMVDRVLEMIHCKFQMVQLQEQEQEQRDSRMH